MVSAGAVDLDSESESETRLPRALPLAAILILFAAALRGWSLWTAPLPPPDLSSVRLAVSQWLETASPLPLEADGSIAAASLEPRLLELGVNRIQFERFDPDALVLMRPGKDGQPGVAGVDDNGDGMTDNRSELGATRSDDVCVVVPQGARPPADEPTLVLQRGAFVSAAATPSPDSIYPQRAIVFGGTGQDAWSFLLVP